MPLHTSSTTLVAAMKICIENPEIFTSHEDRAIFCSDFMLLTRVCVAERAGDIFDTVRIALSDTCGIDIISIED